MSLLHGLVMGSSIRRIVQLGTHAGYSTLLLGFFLRQMNASRGLCTFEIGESLCVYTQGWLERAGLDRLRPRRATEFASTLRRRTLLGNI